MPPDQQLALKEWAVVCAALASGRQTILFRKGGIQEGPDGFVPEHREFWLFPTGFHQSAADVVESFADVAGQILSEPPRTGEIPIRHYGRISDLFWIDEFERLAALRPHHVLTDKVLRQRFDYRRPGLFVLLVETWSLSEPAIIPADPRYDGCRSWVRLNESLSTCRLKRVLPEREFERRRQEIMSRLGT